MQSQIEGPALKRLRCRLWFLEKRNGVAIVEYRRVTTFDLRDWCRDFRRVVSGASGFCNLRFGSRAATLRQLLLVHEKNSFLLAQPSNNKRYCSHRAASLELATLDYA